MKFIKLLFIRGKQEPDSVMPILVGITEENKMHWHAGLTYTKWNPSEYNIVRELEYIDDSSIDNAEEILCIEYGTRPQEPSARLGWISPSGEWYPCGYACHTHLERTLLTAKYQSTYPGLSKRGWIEVKGGALIVIDSSWKTTEESKNTLKRIVEAFEIRESEEPNINWNPILLANPEGYYADSWMTEPTEYLISNETYAQALRSTYELYFGDEGLSSVDKLVEPMAYRIKRADEHPGD